MIYFFIFTWVTGSMTVSRIQPFFSSTEMFEDNSHPGHYEHDDFGLRKDFRSENASFEQHEQYERQHQQQKQEHGIGKISSVTSVHSSSASSHAKVGNESSVMQSNNTRRISVASYHPNEEEDDDEMRYDLDRENNSVSMLRLFLFSDAYSMVQTVNLVLDLLCEVAGVYSSILLIRGLQQEKKSWFWPWMIVVPTHIAIDAITMGGIMMEYILEPLNTPLSLVLLTVTVDVTLNTINAYGLICVISQYQEYKAGRGTAAYVEFTSQTPTILLETAGSTKTVLNKPIAIPVQTRRRSTKDYSSARVYNEKSDTCCEEISMQTMSNANETQSLTDNHIVRAVKNGGVHHETVKNGQATVIALDGENPPSTPSINNNGNNDRSRRASVPTSGNKEGSTGATPKGKFGKYLDVKKRRTSNLPDLDSDECSSDLNSEAHKETQMPNLGIRWEREQSDAARSDSDSEDPTVDVLSAFGILGCGKK